MDTSDDPVSLAIIGGVAYGATQVGKGGGGGGGQQALPTAQATKTAEPVEQLSEQAKRNRRLAASSLTKQFAEPTLGIPALTGA